MTVSSHRSSLARCAVAGLLAATMLTACSETTGSAHLKAGVSKAERALAKGEFDKGVALAEAAVAASPNDAAARAILGQAYMRVGRFQSASTTFDDAMELGDNSPRTALSLALAEVAAGHNRDAVAILDDWKDTIPASDMGLALALAGETARGVSVLADALRGGQANAKVRQNLAYAYALDGRWREARLMAAQDISPAQIDARLSEWAASAKPESYRERVAGLLGVPVRADPGQPRALALNVPPGAEQAAVETAALVPAASPLAANAELSAVTEAPAPAVALAELPSSAAPAPAPQASVAEFAAVLPQAEPSAAPLAAVASQTAGGQQFVSQPMVQAVPAQSAPAVAVRQRPVAPRRVAAATPVRSAPHAGGTHLVQLGSFASAQGARRGWGIFTARNPALRDYRMTITPVVVNGRNYWRVAAAGFDGGSANGMCASLKRRGGACFAYAAARPPVGTPAAPTVTGGGAQLARRR